MKSYRKELSFNVPARRALINITPDALAFRNGIRIEDSNHLVRSYQYTQALSIVFERMKTVRSISDI